MLFPTLFPGLMILILTLPAATPAPWSPSLSSSSSSVVSEAVLTTTAGDRRRDLMLQLLWSMIESSDRVTTLLT